MRGKKVMQGKIFYNFSLDGVVPSDDFYRKLEKAVDLSWVGKRVADRYSEIGRPSIDPEVIAKIELMGYLEGIQYDRKKMRLINDRLSLRRYIGYDIDEAVPDHSTLSKARDLLGEELFGEIFLKSVLLCQQAGMVGGIHGSVDRSLVKANAAFSSLEPRMVDLAPEEHLTRVIAENPVEGEAADNVVELSERREQLPRIGVASGDDAPGQVSADDKNEGQSAETQHVATKADHEMNVDDAAIGRLDPEAVASGQTDDGIVGTESRQANNDAEVVSAEETAVVASKSHAALDNMALPAADIAVSVEADDDEGVAVSSAGAEPAEAKGGKPAVDAKPSKDRVKGPSNDTHVSRTDPDARIASKPGVLPMLSYSVEFWTDSRCGVITHAAAFLATTPDDATVIAGLSRQRSALSLRYASISADKGYGHGRLYRGLNAAHVRGYIPFPKRNNGALAKGIYGIDQFQYDESRNVYVCPAGKELEYSGMLITWPSVNRVWAARKQDCRQCPQREKCTTSPGGRHLSVNIYQREYDEMAQRVQGPGSRLAAIARRTGPEPRFGEGKRWTCMSEAKYRGLDKMNWQALLTATAENIKKLVKCTFRTTNGASSKRGVEQLGANAVQGENLSCSFAFSPCT